MKKQLLVVDDSTDIQRLVGGIFADGMLDLHNATNPQFGLTLAASIKPDLILLDVGMPEMDGYEFCRRLKADPNLWSVPVLFLTGKNATENKVRGLELGAIDYVTKPFSPSELRARVRAVLRTQTRICELEETTLIDRLTGLGNQKMFKERLRGEASRRARSPQPLTCTYVDVDGFQTINNNYGWPFGDLVLKKVATSLRDTYRPEDVLCRLNGDDFAVLLADTTTEQAISMAKAFKRGITANPLEYRGSTIAITCGIAIVGAKTPHDQGMLSVAIKGMEKITDRPSDGLWVQRSAQVEHARMAA